MAATLPVLHIASNVVTFTTVDLRVVALAAMALAVTLAFLWAPALGPAVWSTKRGRRRIAGAALAALVFLAVLPSVVPYDHLMPIPHAEQTQAAERHVHASHCHDTPGTCADAPVTSGPGQLLTSDPLVLVPSMLSIALLTLIFALHGVSRRPELRPPLALI